jgi:fatty acid desaturase
MDNQHHNHVTELDNDNDIALSKPSTSRFLFLLSFFGFFIFAWAGCYNLYEHKYQKNDNITVPDNTLYDPKYK